LSAATLLLVEDDDSIREIVGEVLQSRGYDLLMATNGREALDLLHEREAAQLPKLILLDLMMPEMDGRQFLLERQKFPELVPIPVVVLTAAGRTQTANAQMVVAAWLSKPVELDRLLTTVAQFCPLPHARRSRSSRPPSAPPGERIASPEKIAAFLERRRAELVTLREALATGAYDDLRAIGHNLKGVGAGFGFPQLAELGERLELAADAADATRAGAVIDGITAFLADPPAPSA
jgi:two-component system response regulator CpxR